MKVIRIVLSAEASNKLDWLVNISQKSEMQIINAILESLEVDWDSVLDDE